MKRRGQTCRREIFACVGVDVLFGGGDKSRHARQVARGVALDYPLHPQHGVFRGCAVFKKLVHAPRHYVAGADEIRLDARKPRADVFAYQFIIVDADDLDVLGYAQSGEAACIDRLSCARVVVCDYAARKRQRRQAFGDGRDAVGPFACRLRVAAQRETRPRVARQALQPCGASSRVGGVKRR